VPHCRFPPGSAAGVARGSRRLREQGDQGEAQAGEAEQGESRGHDTEGAPAVLGRDEVGPRRRQEGEEREQREGAGGVGLQGEGRDLRYSFAGSR
jgi:hypothetical protein